MGGITKQLKNQMDPANLLHNKDQPKTFANWVKSAHYAADPFGGTLGDTIQTHNNTQNNLRGTMDPGQLFGSNATTMAPYNPASYQLRGGTGNNPALGAPPNGISTNGLNSTGFTNGLNGPSGTNGLPSQPDWASIIARALRR